MSARIEAVGYTDPTGSDAANREISLARAAHVAAALGALGVAADKLRARGAGVRAEVMEPGCAGSVRRTGCEGGDRRARSVVLRVELDAAGGG